MSVYARDKGSKYISVTCRAISAKALPERLAIHHHVRVDAVVFLSSAGRHPEPGVHLAGGSVRTCARTEIGRARMTNL